VILGAARDSGTSLRLELLGDRANALGLGHGNAQGLFCGGGLVGALRRHRLETVQALCGGAVPERQGL
jgi:hypothetical protein